MVTTVTEHKTVSKPQTERTLSNMSNPVCFVRQSEQETFTDQAAT